MTASNICIDSDIIVLRNMDSLFEVEAELAAVENYESPFSRASSRVEGRDIFNSGMMLIKPNPAVFRKMISELHTIDSYNGGDQGFLNVFWSNNWTRLGTEYNANKMIFKYAKSSFPEYSKLRAVHFVRQKPWYDIALQSERRNTSEMLFDKHDDFEYLYKFWRMINAVQYLRQKSTNVFRQQYDKSYYSTTGHQIPVKIIPFFLNHGQRFSGKVLLTLVTQISINRFDRLEKLCEEWDGHISVAFFVPSNRQIAKAVALIITSDILSLSRVNVHLVIAKDSSSFPINLLRNIALRFSQSEHVFIHDADFMVPSNMNRILTRTASSRNILAKQKSVFVIPAFEMTADHSLGSGDIVIDIPPSKQRVLEMLDKGYIQPFHPRGKGHRATDYAAWRIMSKPYQVTWDRWYEPYLVFNKTEMDFVAFDERFVGKLQYFDLFIF